MASSAGFSIASSPPGAIGRMGLSSPQKSQGSGKKPPSASQLLEQIRRLEAEGDKLRSIAAGEDGKPIAMLASLTDLDGSSNSERVEMPKFTSTSPSTLSALVDYSAEQKTISDLRLQLDRQKKETERLNTQFLSEPSSRASSVVMHPPGSPSKTGFSTLPSTELFSSSRRPASVTGAMDIGPPSHLEKSLKDSQEQVADLRKRLMEMSEQSESEKRQFRLTVEELKAKLHNAMLNRDSVLDLRQKESANLESKIAEQNTTIRELQCTLKAQEQTLSEATRKADGYSRENFVCETTLNQVRVVLVDAERRRGKSYFETDPASQQSPSMLVHTLERCIQEMLKDVEIKKCRVDELEKEMQEIKHSQSSDHSSMSFEHQQKITQMTSDHERQMQIVNERANNARKQANSLETQLSTIHDQHNQQMKLKEDMVIELENKIKHLREEIHDERHKSSSKRESLEHTLHDTEKEMSKLRTERDEATRNHTNMESKLADLQVTVNRLTRDLVSEKESSGKFWDREGEMRSKQAQLETRLEEKTRDVERLEKLLASVKQECNATVTEKVSMIERQERERHMEKVSSLTQQLSEVSQKCNRISLELETTRTENIEMRTQSREACDRADTTKVQYDAAVAERKHLADMLTAKSSDFDRVSQERDYYFNIMDQKNNELAHLKSQKERLTIQIEEKEKSLSMLQEQVTSLQHMLETNSRNSETVREERDLLLQQLQETTTGLEELKASRDTTVKKMKIREKRIRELESEKKKTDADVELRSQEMIIVQQEKDNLYKELKESRYEVASLTDQNDSLRKEIEQQKYQLERSISKLQYRLKSTEQDLGMAQKALRKRESVDNSAVKMADKFQKEVTAKRSLVDTMQTKIRWYQDQLDTVIKEKGHVDGDKDKLKTSLNKALIQNQQLRVDVETANSRAADLKTHAHKLESSLEKAALRNATAQAQVETFEQEMTKMKLAHQLNVKEAVQKATSQYKEKPDRDFSDDPVKLTSTAPVPQLAPPTQVYAGSSHARAPPASLPPAGPAQSYNTADPGQTAQHDRLQAQQSGENYKEIGSELKLLLGEMRNLISDNQASPRDVSPRGSSEVTKRSSEVNRRSRKVRDERLRSKSQTKSRPFEDFPVFAKRKGAFTHCRVPTQLSDISYYSDADVDDRVLNRSRTHAAPAYTMYSPEAKDRRHRPGVGNKKHRRSKSAEASFMLPSRDSSLWTEESDYRSSPTYSPPDPGVSVSNISNTNTEETNQSPDDTSTINSSLFTTQNASETTHNATDSTHNASDTTHNAPDSTQNSSGVSSQNYSSSDTIELSIEPPVMESTKEEDVPETTPPLTDTAEICKRLEERIMSLTRMGDNLQKENKEMADLMKTQGKKLKKVKENEKKIHVRKSAR